MLLLLCAAVACLVLLVAGAGFTLLKVGLGGGTITNEARTALKSVLGPGATSSLGAARISIDDKYHIALDASEVSFDDPVAGVNVTGVRSIKLGLSPFGLVRGRVEVARIEIDGAHIAFRAAGQGAGSLAATLPLGQHGLVDLGDVSKLILSRLGVLASLLDRHHTSAVVLNNVALSLIHDGGSDVLYIKSLELAESFTGLIRLSGNVTWQGKPVTLAATMTRNSKTGDVKDFDASVTGIPFAAGAEDPTAHIGEPGGNIWQDMRLTGRFSAEFRGVAGADGHPTTISAKLSVTNGDFKYQDYPDLPVKAVLNFEQEVGSRKIELRPSRLAVGGLAIDFNGAFGPAPEGATGATGKSAYRFEIVTRDAVSAPRDSPEPALPFGARIAGLYIPVDHNLSIREIGLRTSGGELYGQGSILFGQGSPGIIFALRVPQMPVAQVKQLWPLPVADGARRWILPNLFGGMVDDASIDIAFAPGRFDGPGDPPPLAANEIKIDASIENTRFDVVGDLPPVRDASGHVSVRGAHTTIDIERGTAFLPSNRTAEISNGHLVIPWGPQRPVMATLDIDVAGGAGAIAEIVGYKPLDALRYVNFGPDDVTGKVTSHLSVGFPITRDAPPGSLTWTADMSFDDLSIAKPLDGQLITSAKGTLKVNQDSATIDARAKLNGVPARVTLFEPFSDNGAKRQRTVALELDDKARAKLFPALNTLLSGPVYVNLAMQTPGEQIAAVDLSAAEFKLPWIGWSKGAGVNATATFTVRTNGGRTDISGLDISGGTFHLRGNMAIDFERAHFGELLPVPAEQG